MSERKSFIEIYFHLPTFRWDFKVHGYDIKFGVRAIDQKTGERFKEVELKKISSSEENESGFITCQPNYKCEYSERKNFEVKN